MHRVEPYEEQLHRRFVSQIDVRARLQLHAAALAVSQAPRHEGVPERNRNTLTMRWSDLSYGWDGGAKANSQPMPAGAHVRVAKQGYAPQPRLERVRLRPLLGAALPRWHLAWLAHELPVRHDAEV